MQYKGMIFRYDVNRPLTKKEKENKLDTKKRIDAEPVYQLTVIKINSTFLEIVDKYFLAKGCLTTISSIITSILIGGFAALITFGIFIDKNASEVWPGYIIAFIIISPVIYLMILSIRKEAFSYTHFPIRFNRKNRMIFGFRIDGTVFSVPWDDVHFCIQSLPQDAWEIQGHILAEDGNTVVETFALGYYTLSADDLPSLFAYWEFIRRYMEEGPQAVAHLVELPLNIADRKQTASEGFHHFHAISGTNPVHIILGAIISAFILPGRWFATRMSKLPKWPEQIEERCRIEPNDPYVVG